jgi:ASC-1-like (ASCH) protein
MKKVCYATIFLFALNLSSLIASTPNSCDTITFNKDIIDKHSQLFFPSMIPSAIEMILKLNNKVPGDYYDNQKMWRNNVNGNFINFDSISIKGIRFYQKFNLERGDNFPIDKLFTTIDQELAEKRFVMISLMANNSWWVHVIYGKTENGEYLAFTKAGKKTIFERRVKEIIKKMKGTDIMIYRLE